MLVTDELPELPCPGCEADLAWDELFLSQRICSACARHFYLSPTERVALLVDESGFTPFTHEPDVPPEVQRVASSRERDVVDEAVLTGSGSIEGTPAVLVLLNEHAMGAQLGALATEKIVHAFEQAHARRLPVIVCVAGGTGSAVSSPLSLVQPTRISSAISQLHTAGLPSIAVVCQSASAELFGSLAGGCDLIVAEPGTKIWSGHAIPTVAPSTTSDLFEQGLLDDVVSRSDIRKYLANLLSLIANSGTASAPPEPPVVSAQAPRSNSIAARDYIEHLIASRIDIHGDRAQTRARSVTAGIGRLDGRTVCFATFDAEPELDEPAAVRMLIRVVNLASRWDIPLVILVGDGGIAGSSPSLAITHARLAGVLAVAPVPVLTGVVGEIRSGLGRTLSTGDQVLCSAGASFAFESGPSGPSRPPVSAGSRVNAIEAQRLGLVDLVVQESPESLAESSRYLRDALVISLGASGTAGYRRRLSERLQKFKSAGLTTPAGIAAIQQELNEFRDRQKNFSRTVEELRDRWEDFRTGKSGIPFQRPDFTEFADRVRARRDELRERAGLTDRN